MDWHLIFVDNKRKEINENEVQRAIFRVTRGIDSIKPGIH